MDLRGRVCLITGAAQGIGEATARALSRRGAQLVLADLRLDRLEAQQGMSDALRLEMDVRDVAAIEAGVARAVERFGALDVVVNNAGVGIPRDIHDLDEEVWNLTIDVNLNGPYRVVKAALPHLQRSRGHIATVASMAARLQTPLLGHYSASKAGVAAFSETLRIELRPDGIGITTVYFGTIDTPMVARALADPATPQSQQEMLARGRRLGITPLVPVARAGEAIAAGIERERRAVVLPRRWRPIFHLPAPMQRLIERTS